MDKQQFPILDDLIHTIAVGEPYYGLEEDTLGTQEDVDETAAQMLRETTKDFRLRIPNTLPDVEKVVPPSLTVVRAKELLSIKRSPTDWAPRHVTLNEQPQQLVPSRPGRKQILVFNCSANVYLGTSRNDVLLNDAGTGPISNKYYTIYSTAVNASSSTTIESEGPVWALSLTLGVTLELFETYWNEHRLQEAEDFIENA